MLLKEPIHHLIVIHDITFNARIELIVLKGLRTLKLLKEDKFTDWLPPIIKGSKEVVTMIKSRIFHPSRK